jgi:hypothetical protein
VTLPDDERAQMRQTLGDFALPGITRHRLGGW